jgi:hypothetical protein
MLCDVIGEQSGVWRIFGYIRTTSRRSSDAPSARVKITKIFSGEVRKRFVGICHSVNVVSLREGGTFTFVGGH